LRPIEPKFVSLTMAAVLDVELEHDALERVVAGERALEDRVQRPAVLGQRHRLEAVGGREVRRAAEQQRVVGRHDAGCRHRRVEDPAPISLMIGNGTLRSGSCSEIALRTLTVPLPP
jgi:hypothetical protein